jgi:ketosteroid isomerase-like protein
MFHQPTRRHIEKAAFMQRCFPTASRLRSQEIVQIVAADEDGVFIMYEYVLRTGERHRNVEFIRVRDGRLVEPQVYFGGHF